MYENEISYQYYSELLESFVAEMQYRIDKDYKENYDCLTPPTINTTKGGKYIKVTRVHEDSNDSVICFIATQSFTNKTMGKVEAGDIFKAATYKTPAKHARGNILNDDNGFSAFSRGGNIRYAN